MPTGLVSAVARGFRDWSRTVFGGADCSSAVPATEWGGWVQVKLSRIALVPAVTLSLVGGSLLAGPSVSAQCIDAEGNEVPAVMISGGTITNETVIDISANAGTSISDASGGSNNLATTSGGGEGVNTGSSGNGGVATSAANGGAISTGNINSGGNVGNAIEVGNTACAPWSEPVYDEPVYEEPVYEDVVALPATGIGGIDGSAIFALIASAGAAVTSLGLRRR